MVDTKQDPQKEASPLQQVLADLKQTNDLEISVAKAAQDNAASAAKLVGQQLANDRKAVENRMAEVTAQHQTNTLNQAAGQAGLPTVGGDQPIGEGALQGQEVFDVPGGRAGALIASDLDLLGNLFGAENFGSSLLGRRRVVGPSNEQRLQLLQIQERSRQSDLDRTARLDIAEIGVTESAKSRQFAAKQAKEARTDAQTFGMIKLERTIEADKEALTRRIQELGKDRAITEGRAAQDVKEFEETISLKKGQIKAGQIEAQVEREFQTTLAGQSVQVRKDLAKQSADLRRELQRNEIAVNIEIAALRARNDGKAQPSLEMQMKMNNAMGAQLRVLRTSSFQLGQVMEGGQPKHVPYNENQLNGLFLAQPDVGTDPEAFRQFHDDFVRAHLQSIPEDGLQREAQRFQTMFGSADESGNEIPGFYSVNSKVQRRGPKGTSRVAVDESGVERSVFGRSTEEQRAGIAVGNNINRFAQLLEAESATRGLIRLKREADPILKSLRARETAAERRLEAFQNVRDQQILDEVQAAIGVKTRELNKQFPIQR